MDDKPLTVRQVSDFLKTKCPNHIVAFGFTTPYVMGLEQCRNKNVTMFDMAERITVSNMVGTLSHAIRENHGDDLMTWPVSMGAYSAMTMEYVTMDTLEEMGMKSNE